MRLHTSLIVLLGLLPVAPGRDRVLLPSRDTLYRDEHPGRVARDGLEQVDGYEMLVAFVGDRDYAKAERLAKLLAERDPRSRFHDYAVRLAKQLPRRRDDFGKFRLPTPAEWAGLKAMLTRAQQIDYLCQRMRLLNCFQWGQPGGFHYSDTQYTEPCGLSQDAAWGLRRGKTEVINPVVELVGPIDGLRLPGEKRPTGLELTIADIPQLAPYLEDDWFLLIVSFWRDFHPDRTLHGTRELFGVLINRLANQDICRVGQMEKMTDAERHRHIEGIVRWAKDNQGKTEGDLLVKALEDGLKAGTRWYEVEPQAERLVNIKDKRAVPVMIRFLHAKNVDRFNRQEILDCCRRLDPGAARDTATRYLEDRDQGVRLQAALLLFQTGDRGAAREELGRVLESDDEYSLLMSYRMIDAVDLLLKEGSMESRRTALRLFASPKLKHMGNEQIRAGLLRRFTTERLPEPFRFYLPLLSIKGHQLGSAGFAKPVTEKFADEITDIFAPTDPDVQKIKKAFPKTAGRIPALKKWLEERAAAPKPIPGRND